MDSHLSQDYDNSEANQDSMPPVVADSELGGMYPHYDRMRYIQNYPEMGSMQQLMLNDNRKKLLTATKASNEGETEEAIGLLQGI